MICFCNIGLFRAQIIDNNVVFADLENDNPSH